MDLNSDGNVTTPAEDLQNALQTGESRNTEFVSNFESKRHIVETICAFANTDGGTIYVGVDESNGDDPPRIIGADFNAVGTFVAELDRHFREPVPQTTAIPIDDIGQGQTVVAIRVKKNRTSEPTSLSDGIQWKRLEKQNVRPHSGSGTLSTVAGATIVAGQAGETAITQKLEVHVGKHAHRSGSPDVQTFGNQLRLQRESKLEETGLNVNDYAEVIAEVLSEAGPEERMSFALFGHWGRGKTYLTKLVCEQLRKGNTRYYAVNFSAWKFRTTPETWAFLFGQFLKEGIDARGQGLRLRAAVERHRIWPIIFALLGLLIALIPTTERVSFVLGMFQVVGLGTTIFVTAVFLRFTSTVLRLQSFYSFAGHADKLGLQAAIGDDLRALLMAWIPTKQLSWTSFLAQWFSLLCYVVLGSLIAWQLWPDQGQTGASTVTLPLVDTFDTDLNPWVLLAFFLAWLIIWLGALIYVFSWRSLIPFLPASSSEKILLVVDDLDRCEPEQMLEVIESTMLILDDPEIHRRLQVLMLVDESAFCHALLKKYKHVACGTPLPNDVECCAHHITQENLEKFFLVHLRLPALTEDEVGEITKKFLDQLGDRSGSPAASTSNTEPADTSQNPSSDGNISANASDVHERKHPETSGGSVLSTSEKEALLNAIKELASRKPGGMIGPRTIRCLIFRYQLARSILRKLKRTEHLQELAEVLIQSHLHSGIETVSDNRFIRQVVRQVC